MHTGSLFAAGQAGAAPGPQFSQVVKINPNTLKVQELIREPYTDVFGTHTVAIQIGKEHLGTAPTQTLAQQSQWGLSPNPLLWNRRHMGLRPIRLALRASFGGGE